MGHNCYSEINLHVTWHTKTSAPLLTAAVEPLVHEYLRQRLLHTGGVYVHAIGGTETHIHLAVTVAPTILVSDLVGQLKGSCSHEINQRLGKRDKSLQWQSGYGVVSFGTGDLEWVKQYILNQRSHHQSGRSVDRLERITQSESDG